MSGPLALRTSSVEGTLLHLLLHGIKHAWHSLHWLCDVAELVRRHPALDWNSVLAWSDHPGRRRLVDVGLSLASELWTRPSGCGDRAGESR